MTRREQQFDQAAGTLAAEIRIDQRGEEQRRHPDDARQALHGELRERVAGLGRQHDRKVPIALQRVRGDDNRAHEKVFEVDRADDTLFEFDEELLELAHAHRVEHHVFAAGEHAVQRRPRHPRLGGDVVDAHLGNAPTLVAGLGGIENAGFGRSHWGETIR